MTDFIQKIIGKRLAGFWCLLCGREFSSRKEATEEDIFPRVLNGGLKIFVGQYTCYNCNTVILGSKVESQLVNEPFYQDVLLPVLAYYQQKQEGIEPHSVLPAVEDYQYGFPFDENGNPKGVTIPSFSPVMSRVLAKTILGTAAFMMPAWVFMEEEEMFEKFRSFILTGQPNLFMDGLHVVGNRDSKLWEDAHYVIIKELPPNKISINVRLCGHYGLGAFFNVRYSPEYLSSAQRSDHVIVRFGLMDKLGGWKALDQKRNVIHSQSFDLPVRVTQKFLKYYYERILIPKLKGEAVRTS